MGEQRRKTGNNVAVFGSPMADSIWNLTDGPLRPGISTTAEMYTRIGGKGPNAGAVLANLGRVVYLVGQTGRDQEGEESRRVLKQQGLNVEFLSYHETLPTGGVALFATAGEDYADITLSHVANFDPNPQRIDDFFETMGNAIDSAYLTLEAPFIVTERIVRIAAESEQPIPLFCDASAFRDVPEAYLPLFRHIDTVAPNRYEAQSLLGEGVEIHSMADARVAAGKLLRYGSKEVIVTLGRDGAFYKSAGGEEIEVPPIPIYHELTDIGVGDAFRAVYHDAKQRGETTMEALDRARKAGAFVAAHTLEVKVTLQAINQWYGQEVARLH
jgi:ribokinase